MNVPEKLEVPVVVRDMDGNEHEVERFVYRLERNCKSRWAELFGTPERAARTLFESTSECRCCVIRSECGYDLDKCVMYDHDALLEWLRGESDGK